MKKEEKNSLEDAKQEFVEDIRAIAEALESPEDKVNPLKITEDPVVGCFRKQGDFMNEVTTLNDYEIELNAFLTKKGLIQKGEKQVDLKNSNKLVKSLIIDLDQLLGKLHKIPLKHVTNYLELLPKLKIKHQPRGNTFIVKVINEDWLRKYIKQIEGCLKGAMK